MFTAKHNDLLLNLAREKLDIDLTDLQIGQFLKYGELLVDWNQRINLTSITEPEEIIIKHFIDSLTIGKFIKGENLVDVGTGAGFPGLPIKILFPDLQVFLVDSLAKRLDFLKAVISELALTKVEVIHARAEDFGQDKKYRNFFDVVTSRAVARLPVLLEYAIPLLKINGSFLAAKGSQAEEEVSEAQQALQILGAKVRSIERLSLGLEAEHRAIVIVDKVKQTPNQYPRKAGTPAKKPLGT